MFFSIFIAHIGAEPPPKPTEHIKTFRRGLPADLRELHGSPLAPPSTIQTQRPLLPAVPRSPKPRRAIESITGRGDEVMTLGIFQQASERLWRPSTTIHRWVIDIRNDPTLPALQAELALPPQMPIPPLPIPGKREKWGAPPANVALEERQQCRR